MPAPSSNPPIAHVPPPSRQSERAVDRQAKAAPRRGMHPHWTASESRGATAAAASMSTPPRRNLFGPGSPHRMVRRALADRDADRDAAPARGGRRTNAPARSSSGEYCGLTAEITRELRQRSSAKKAARVDRRGDRDGDADAAFDWSAETPPRVSRTAEGVFRASEAGRPAAAPAVSASGSEDAAPGEGVENDPPRQRQAAPATLLSSKKKRGIGTPLRMPKSGKKIFSSAKKIKKCLTPPREGFGSHLKSLSSRTDDCRDAPHLPGLHSRDEIETQYSPGSALSTAFAGADEFKIHSTEYDPFDFQCELPPKREVRAHAKICGVVDGYTAVHLGFNFAMLAGLTRNTLRREYERSTDEKPVVAGSCHREVIRRILECEDDLVVEGFFREYVGDRLKDKSDAKAAVGSGGKDDRIEAVVFSSEKLRQIIVCFRGSTASQAKPLKVNYFGKEVSSLLHEEQQVRTLSAFRDAYFGTPMEETVFALLANLATRKPFFDVVMTGHSFGGALATIGAVRYATANPMMRVSCHVFGCPRIGGEDWRQLVHSLANLKVFRVENASDPYVALPSGSEWVQVGHAISVVDATSPSEGAGASAGPANGSSSNNVQFTARRFDRDRIASNSGVFDLIRCPKVNLPRNLTGQGLTAQGKVDHEMKSYVDKIVSSGERWFTDFVGMEGNGVISFADNERRCLA